MLLLVVVLGCKSTEEPSIEIPGPEYFPLTKGSYITYKVDSVRIIQNVETEYLFELRVSVTGSFTNAEGNTAYILQREKRADATKPWKLAGTWTAWKDISRAVVTEGNTSYVKLQFPLSVGIGWNGNDLNDLGGPDRCNGSDCDRYELTEMDSLAIVKQDSAKDVIRKDVRFERYSKNVGLVYKESTVYKYCTDNTCSNQVDFILDGVRYKQEMIDNGTL
jgi:hypothetical protein